MSGLLDCNVREGTLSPAAKQADSFDFILRLFFEITYALNSSIARFLYYSRTARSRGG